MRTLAALGLALAFSTMVSATSIRGSDTKDSQHVLASEDSQLDMKLEVSAGLVPPKCSTPGVISEGITPHPDYPKILASVKALPVLTWDEDQVLFRVQDAEYARIHEIINGKGAWYAGARWGSRCIAQVYLSRKDSTALEECKQATQRNKNVALRVQTYPRLVVALFYTGKTYVDLTTTHMAALATATGHPGIYDTENWSALQKDNKESWSQAVGRALYGSGVHAMLVTSTADKTGQGLNMVVFPGDDPTKMLSVDDQDRIEMMLRLGSMTDAELAKVRRDGRTNVPSEHEVDAALAEGFSNPEALEFQQTNPMHQKKQHPAK